jgi:O-antigen ligase
VRVARASAPWLALGAVSAAVGVVAAGEAQPYIGERIGSVFVAALSAGALFVVFSQVGFPVLLAWPVITGLAYPFIRFPRDDATVTFDRIWVLGMLGCIAVSYGSVRLSPQAKRLSWAFALFVVTFGIRTATSQGFTLSTLQIWLDAIAVPFVLFVTTMLLASSKARVVQVAGAMMIGGGVLAVLGIAQRIGVLDLAGYSGGQIRLESALETFRIAGPYPVPEPYALSVVICLGATLFWLQARGRSHRLIGSAFAALQVAAIALTLFRAAWIAALFVIVGALGLRPGRWARLVLLVGAIAAVLFAATTQLKSSTLFSERVENTENIYARLATWKQGFEIFRSEPVFGIGVNRYEIVSSSLPPEEVHGAQSVTFAHGSATWLLAEQGLFGFIPVVLVALAVWGLFRALRRWAIATDTQVLVGTAVGVVLGYLVMALTLTMIAYGQSNAFLAVLLGLVAAVCNIERAQADRTGRPLKHEHRLRLRRVQAAQSNEPIPE